jgi:hypothetical protein
LVIGLATHFAPLVNCVVEFHQNLGTIYPFGEDQLHPLQVFINLDDKAVE